MRINYAKGLIESLNYAIGNYELSKVDCDVLQASILDLKEGQKFLLPDDGYILGNRLKGLPAILRLPFPITILYVPSSTTAMQKMELRSLNADKKRVIICKELVDEEGKERIMVQSFYQPRMKTFGDCEWSPTASYLMFDREIRIDEDDIFYHRPQYFVYDFVGDNPEAIATFLKPALASDVNCLFELLEALSCSNVSYEKRVNAMKKQKGKPAIDYDSYHELVVNVSGDKTSGVKGGGTGSGIQRREHFRRGHIHTYHTKQGPIKLWINAVVVNPGIGGKIEKVYSVK
jgi:hypothetical protein